MGRGEVIEGRWARFRRKMTRFRWFPGPQMHLLPSVRPADPNLLSYIDACSATDPPAVPGDEKGLRACRRRRPDSTMGQSTQDCAAHSSLRPIGLLVGVH